ncbi:M28 family peptidase [Taklimakanibacter lacteus]|uniref:M28 family peptidase n=1 Tax=Taklimakanibacter lacteus TaxID=2268456 RepID=UPI000E6695EC
MKRVFLELVLAAFVVFLALYAVTVQPLVRPLPAKSPPVSPERLAAHVRMLSETLHPRSIENLTNLEAAADYVHKEFTASGAAVADQWFEIQGEKYRNVIARFGPAEGSLLVIGAHYDSFETTPGADDNASGVAGLIELARLLGQNPPRRPVELVAYTLEEPPHFRTEQMGSAHHARSLSATGREVSLMLALEMIGWYSDLPDSQSYPFPGMDLIYPDRGNFIAIIGRLNDWSQTRKVKAAMAGASDLPAHSINTLPVIPGVDFSDHQAYWNEGFPALMITDTAFYRNPHYHEAEDTADKLDYQRMAKVVQAVFAVVQSYE